MIYNRMKDKINIFLGCALRESSVKCQKMKKIGILLENNGADML